MGGSRNLVIFLGIALVIVRFLTSSQRSALAGLWNVGAPKKTKTPIYTQPGFVKNYNTIGNAPNGGR